MAMSFFEHQEVARRKTGRLVILFGLAVIAIVVGVYLVVAGGLLMSGELPVSSGEGPWMAILNPTLIGIVVVSTVAVIAVASLYKLAELRGGGRVIAERLGGRLLLTDSADPVERKILNVVEEMAIASGTPAPPVYLLADEKGINAFAAGYSPDDAVIGVTRGCVELLSRDELQGVIAHEFSHILNGDMRLNIRLIGLLHGILVLGIIGYYLMRASFWTGATHRRSRRGGKEGGGGAAMIIVIGLGLIVIGAIGTFFGSMIKAAVSRQREFLADASAVQFTRQPEGIGGALKKIGGHPRGARIAHPNAPEASHMYFGEGVARGFSALFHTHPPLPERIRRILPSWDGEFEKIPELEKRAEEVRAEQREWEKRREQRRKAMAAMAGLGGAALAATHDETPSIAEQAASFPETAMSLIGRPTEAHLERARMLADSLPEVIRQAAHEPFGAQSIIYALLLDRDAEIRRGQIGSLAKNADPASIRELSHISSAVDGLNSSLRLLVVDIAAPALRNVSRSQYQRFRANIVALVEADQRISLFEWCLQWILLRRLDLSFGLAQPNRAHYYSLNRLMRPLAVALARLAYAGANDDAHAKSAFEAAAAHVGLEIRRSAMPQIEECGIDALNHSMDKLGRVTPPLKAKIIEAAAIVISHDRELKQHEAELFRAFADALDVPIPPILPGQSLM